MATFKLNMFEELLPALDRHDMDFYDGLDDEKKKAFAGVVAMRFMSATKGSLADWYLIATNSRANVHFFDLQSHPELQYKLLASNGTGKSSRHEWIANSKKGEDALLCNFILQYWPHVNSIEIDVLLSQFDKTTFSEFVDGTGVDVDEAKRVKRSFEARRI